VSDPAINIQIQELKNHIQKGQLARCEISLDKLLQESLSTDQLCQIYYLQALLYRLQKRHNDALSTLQKLKEITPSPSRMHQEMGYNYRAMGNIKQAANEFYAATKANPALLSSWQALLPIYQAQKQSEAISLCVNHIDALKKLPAQILAASDLLHDGNTSAADKVCRAYLREHKHSIPGLFLLADIALKLKAVSEAEFILETCVELAPDDLEAKYRLFKVSSKLGKFPLALTLSKELTLQAPNNIFYSIAKASALVGVGELQAAINLYQSIIQADKAESNVYLLLGHAYKSHGDIQNAINAYQQAYVLNPLCGDAFWSLANTKTYRFTQQEISQMIAGVESSSIDIDDKIHMHFALGKAFEDIQEFDTSFSHYALGNELKRAQLNYSSDKHKAFVDLQINTFTPAFRDGISDAGHTDEAPIFILGLPRAGSTLLEQILASHSQVDGTMELHEILGFAARLSKTRGNNKSYPANLADLPKSTLKELGKQFIDNTQVYRGSAAYFIDKMPNNFLHIGLIKAILPNAKIIDARRNPYACCFSGFKQLFGEGQEFSYSLADMGDYYQQYERLMLHWNSLYPSQILQVNHEEIVADTETQIRRILDYCGLEFEQACLDFHKNKRAVKTPSAEQVRQPIYTRGLEQWKHFEGHLGELKQRFSEG